MSRPTETMDWASGASRRTEPTVGEKANGFVEATRTPAKKANWPIGALADWVNYLDPIALRMLASPARNYRKDSTPVSGESGWEGVAQNNRATSSSVGTIIMVGNDGGGTEYAGRSLDDGLTWTSIAANFVNSGDVHGIIVDDDTFIVAIDASGTLKIETSPDGTTWTERLSVASIAVANYGRSMRSYNGVSLIAAGTNLLRSTDGTTWADLGAASAPYSSGALASNGTRWVQVNQGANGVSTSDDDGDTWTVRSSSIGFDEVIYSEAMGLFVAIDEASTTGGFHTSSDGETWTLAQAWPSTIQFREAKENAGVFVVADHNKTPDGLWVCAYPGAGDLNFVALNGAARVVGQAGGRFFATLLDGTIFVSDNF